MGFLDSDTEKYTVTMATMRGQQETFYYAKTPDGPFRNLSLSPRHLSDELDILIAIRGSIPSDCLATRAQITKVLGEPCDVWEVMRSPGAPVLLAFVPGEQSALLGNNAASLDELLAELRRERRYSEQEATRHNKRESDRPRLEAEAERRHEERLQRSRQVMARPEVATELDAILGAYRTTMWRPITKAADPSSRASGYNLNPWMAHGENWPRVGGFALMHVLQLQADSLPEEARKLIGEGAVLQFFYGVEGNESGTQDGILLRRVFPRDTAGEPMQPPDDAASEGEPLVITGWRPEPDSYMGDVPDDTTNDDDDLTSISMFEEKHGVIVEEPYSGCHGDKLLGGAASAQEFDWPMVGKRRMVMLFQFDCLNGKADETSPAEALWGVGHIFIDPKNPDHMIYRWDCD